MDGLLVTALLALAACAALFIARFAKPTVKLVSAAATAAAEHRLLADAFERRHLEEARRAAVDRVVQLGRECEDSLIAANLAAQLRLPNLTAAQRRAAERCAREALSIAHEVKV